MLGLQRSHGNSIGRSVVSFLENVNVGVSSVIVDGDGYRGLTRLFALLTDIAACVSGPSCCYAIRHQLFLLRRRQFVPSQGEFHVSDRPSELNFQLFFRGGQDVLDMNR